MTPFSRLLRRSRDDVGGSELALFLALPLEFTLTAAVEASSAVLPLLFLSASAISVRVMFILSTRTLRAFLRREDIFVLVAVSKVKGSW